MAAQFIYVMKGLRKVVPPSRVILNDIWLSFYPGAKIGVLGANGAGKSSLLRIMAGIDHDFHGEAWARKGRASATCRRSRSSTPRRPRQRRDRGQGPARHARPVQRDRHEVRGADGRQGWKSCSTSRHAAGVHRPPRPVEPRQQDRGGDGRAALPAGRRRRHDPVGRREAPRGALPGAAGGARPAAARRAHQPPRRRIGGWLEHYLETFPGHRGGHHPRPVLPGQRGQVDPRTRPWARRAVRGELQRLAGAEDAAHGAGGEGRQHAAEDARARTRVGAHVARRGRPRTRRACRTTRTW